MQLALELAEHGDPAADADRSPGWLRRVRSYYSLVHFALVRALEFAQEFAGRRIDRRHLGLDGGGYVDGHGSVPGSWERSRASKILTMSSCLRYQTDHAAYINAEIDIAITNAL